MPPENTPAANLRLITAADIPTIITIGRRIWQEHYVPIIGQAQVDYMTGMRFTPEVLSRYLADAPEKSLSATTSHTLILAPDGTPVPHFADLDPRATDLTKQALVLHPIVPLADQTRYSVFVFGVKSKGALAPTPEGFRRIRDDNTGGEAALAPQLNAWKTRLSPLAKKLGIGPGTRLAVLGAPDGFTIEALPDDVVPRPSLRGVSDVILAFHTSRAELARRLKVACVATGNVHAHARHRGPLQDAFVAVRLHTTLDASEPQRRGNFSHVLAAPGAMAARFAEAIDRGLWTPRSNSARYELDMLGKRRAS